MARKKLPENWEDIDIKHMRLPKSKKHGRRRKEKKPQPELAAALATAVLSHCHKQSSHKSVAEEKPVKKRKKKQKKARHYQSYNKWCAEHDDWVVERKPVYTNHAKQRLSEGRSGEFVTAKRGNAVVVITVLPQADGPRKRLENIRLKENRKNKLFKYKIR